MEESGEDSAPEYTEANMLLMYQQKCSICFDNSYDFCLDKCRDQFCKQCFGRYASELIKGSVWGMNVAEIKCPVCFENLKKEEWSKYVSDQVLAMYEKNSCPFKSYHRCCPSCDEKVYLMVNIHSDGALVTPELLFENASDLDDNRNDESQVEKYYEIYDQIATRKFNEVSKLLDILLKKSDKYGVVEKFKSMCHRYLHEEECDGNGPVSLMDIHTFAMLGYKKLNFDLEFPRAKTLRFVPYKKRRVSEPLSDSDKVDHLLQQKSQWAKVSSLILSLEPDPKNWKDHLFWQLKKFPRQFCPRCSVNFCFQCGELGYHEDRTCLQWMKGLVFSRKSERIRSLKEKERIANIRWKLNNSKSCPRCYTLINRDDGCNKVDCTMCGQRFCWACLSPWSEKCGFYKCKLDDTFLPTPPVSANENGGSHPSHTELGVPDVFALHSRGFDSIHI